jgi:hypothetical protein
LSSSTAIREFDLDIQSVTTVAVAGLGGHSALATPVSEPVTTQPHSMVACTAQRLPTLLTGVPNLSDL